MLNTQGEAAAERNVSRCRTPVAADMLVGQAGPATLMNAHAELLRGDRFAQRRIDPEVQRTARVSDIIPGRAIHTRPTQWLSDVRLRRTLECMDFARITVDPDIMAGVPTIRGLRIPVATVLVMLADGMAAEEICLELPDLELEDIREALRYAAMAVRDRDLPLLSA